MGTIDDIKKMQEDGKSDLEIRETLRARGLSNREIDEVISQSKIKDAVASSGNSQSDYPEGALQPQGFEGMQPSLVSEVEDAPVQDSSQSASAITQNYQEQPQGFYGDTYSQYQPYQNSVSSDVISEISEQVVDERLSYLREKIEKTLDFRTVAEAKMNAIDERLKRIEKIIDRLQVSILQKVGDYVTDVKDLKKEIQETQKSVKAAYSSKKQHHSK